MKHTIDIDTFIILIYWIRIFCFIENKKFEHDNLMSQAETYKYNNTPLDTNIHNIDAVMLDAFNIYARVKIVEDNVSLMSFFSSSEVFLEVKKFKEIFDDIIENYKFEDINLKAIQKGILEERMKKFIGLEDYESAARIRDAIKTVV
jgi:hypothetical protein